MSFINPAKASLEPRPNTQLGVSFVFGGLYLPGSGAWATGREARCWDFGKLYAGGLSAGTAACSGL